MKLIPIVLFGLYALAILGYRALFVGRSPQWGRLARPLFMAGLLLHVIYVGMVSVELRGFPVTSLPEALNLVGLALGLVYLFLEWRSGTQMTGLFVLPMVAVLALLGELPSSTPGPPVRLPGAWFAVHTASAILSYCAFALAAVHGLLYLMLYQELKEGRFSQLYHRLPSLEQMSKMCLRSTLVGFLLLGTAMAIGGLWLAHSLPAYLADPKVIGTVVVWCVFGAALLSHYVWSRGGPLSIYLSLTGVALLLVTTWLSSRLAGSFHRFH